MLSGESKPEVEASADSGGAPAGGAKRDADSEEDPVDCRARAVSVRRGGVGAGVTTRGAPTIASAAEWGPRVGRTIAVGACGAASNPWGALPETAAAAVGAD